MDNMFNKTNHFFIHRPLTRCDGIVRDAEYTEKGNHDCDRNSKTTEFRSYFSHLRCRRSVVITGTVRCLECWLDTSFSASGQHIYLPSAISAALKSASDWARDKDFLWALSPQLSANLFDQISFSLQLTAIRYELSWRLTCLEVWIEYLLWAFSYELWADFLNCSQYLKSGMS